MKNKDLIDKNGEKILYGYQKGPSLHISIFGYNRIPNSTNGLGSFFDRLKGHMNVHRGLSKKHCRQYIKCNYDSRINDKLSSPYGKKNKLKKTSHIGRLIPLGKSYCWQVAHQHCLLPLQIDNLMVIQFAGENHQPFLASSPKRKVKKSI